MNCDISSVRGAVSRLETTASIMKNALTDWRDSVGSSYSGLANEYAGCVGKMQDALAKMGQQCSILSGVDTEGIVSAAGATCSAIDGV